MLLLLDEIEGALDPDAEKLLGTETLDCQYRVPLAISSVNSALHVVSVKPATGENVVQDKLLGVTVAVNATGSPTLNDVPVAVRTAPLAQYCCARRLGAQLTKTKRAT
jgi:hypothetical protein